MRLGNIAALPDGSVVVAGTFEGDLTLGPLRAEAEGVDLFVARFDVLGQPQWLRRFGAEGVAMTLGDVAATANGIVLGGSFDGEVSFDTVDLIADDVDALVLELDVDGLITAVESFGGTGEQRLTAVQPLSMGVALGGDFEGGLERNGLAIATTDAPDERDAFVVVRSTGGATAWSSIAADPGSDTDQRMNALALVGGQLVAAWSSAGVADLDGDSVFDAQPSAAFRAWDDGGTSLWTTVATSDVEVMEPRIVDGWLALSHQGTLQLTSSCGGLDAGTADGLDGVVLAVDAGGCLTIPTRFGGSGTQVISAVSQGVVAGQFDQELVIAGSQVATGADEELFLVELGAAGVGWTTTAAEPACFPGECGLAVVGERMYFATTFFGTTRAAPSRLAASGDEGDGLLGVVALGSR